MICRGKIYLFDSIGFLVLYVVYISVVIIGRIINQKIRQKQQQVDEAALIDNNVTGKESSYPNQRVKIKKRILS